MRHHMACRLRLDSLKDLDHDAFLLQSTPVPKRGVGVSSMTRQHCMLLLDLGVVLDLPPLPPNAPQTEMAGTKRLPCNKNRRTSPL
jgi:hypothetical protein